MKPATPSWRVIWFMLPGCICALSVSLRAVAQHAERVSSDEFAWHIEALGLTDSERDRAQHVFDKYDEEIEGLANTTRACYDFLSGGPYEQVVGRLPTEFDEDDAPMVLLSNRFSGAIRSRSAELLIEVNQSYFAQLRLISSAKSTLIDSFNRTWRRKARLENLSRPFGANVDLVRLVAGSINDANARERLQPFLRQWEDEIDRLLLEYEQTEINPSDRVRNALRAARDGEMDIAEAADIVATGAILRSRILHTTERFRLRLLHELDDDERRALERAWYESKYPFVWTRRNELAAVERRLSGAPDGSDRHPELRSLIDSIDQKRERVTRRLDGLQRDAQSEQTLRQYYHDWVAWFVDRERPSPVNEAEDLLEETSRTFLTEIDALGTELTMAASDSAGTIWSPEAYANEADFYSRWMFTPNFTNAAHEDALAMIPKLSDDQRLIIRDFHARYIRDFEAGSRAYRQEVEAAVAKRERESDGRWQFLRPESFDPAQRGSDYDATDQLKWRAERPVLEQRFAEEVALVLNEEQRVEWERIIRRQRRQTHLPPDPDAHRWSGFHPAACDFVVVIEELELEKAQRDSIETKLHAFEIAIDQVLNRAEIHLPARLLERFIAERKDPDRSDPQTEAIRNAVFEEFEAFRREAARICLTYYDRLLAQLPEDRRFEFENLVGRQMWRNLYDPSPAEIALETIRELDELPPHIIQQVEAIEDRYYAKRRPIYAEVVEHSRNLAVHGWDEELQQEFTAARQAFYETARAEPDVFRVLTNPVAEPWRDRLLLSLQTCRQIRRLFSKAEFDSLPANLRLILVSVGDG